jgi:hypothetical protein
MNKAVEFQEIVPSNVESEIVETGIREYDVSELMGGEAQAFCSIEAVDPETKAIVFNAANNPDHKVKEFVNKQIDVKDIYAEIIEIANEETGEITKVPRIVLIDATGLAYECVSVGMFAAIRKLVAIYGAPTWEPPLTVTVKQKSVGKGSMYTLQM